MRVCVCFANVSVRVRVRRVPVCFSVRSVCCFVCEVCVYMSVFICLSV